VGVKVEEWRCRHPGPHIDMADGIRGPGFSVKTRRPARVERVGNLGGPLGDLLIAEIAAERVSKTGSVGDPLTNKGV